MEPVRLQKLSLEPRINLSFKSGELDSPALLVASELLLNFGQGSSKQWSCVAQVQCRGRAFEFESKLVPAPGLSKFEASGCFNRQLWNSPERLNETHFFFIFSTQVWKQICLLTWANTKGKLFKNLSSVEKPASKRWNNFVFRHFSNNLVGKTNWELNLWEFLEDFWKMISTLEVSWPEFV